jgi:hypothetical protein
MSDHLVLVPSAKTVTIDDPSAELPRCKGCSASIRPHGSTEAEFPGTVPSWGNRQCRICDYTAAGKDPAIRFIPVQRVSYLSSLRSGYEIERLRRGVPPEGSRGGRVPLTDFLNQIS